MGNKPLTLDDLYDIAIKLDPDFLFVDKRVKIKADSDRVLLFEKEKILKSFPDGVIPTTQRAVKSILKIYIENSRQTIDIGLDNFMLPALQKSSIFMKYFNERHYRPHRNKPWCHLINLQPYQLLKDETGRELPDVPENRIPTELLSTIYEIYTGRKVNIPIDDSFGADKQTPQSLIRSGINYWKYRPGNLDNKGDEGFDKNWEEDLSQGVMNQKQEHLGDIHQYKSEEELHKARQENSGRVRNAWVFCNEMRIGDIVIVCKAKDEVVGIGRVIGEYFYCDNDLTRYHKRRVDWLSTEHFHIDHGLLQGSFARYNLSNLSAKSTLENILSQYANALSKQSNNDSATGVSVCDVDADDGSFFPETAGITEKCFEGAVMQVSVNRYERSPEARNRCIEQYGSICLICGFDFEKTYGELGKGFIHVHHITPISEIGEEYEVDYKNDLMPVCPNCHAMLHRKINGHTLSIPELRRIVAK